MEVDSQRARDALQSMANAADLTPARNPLSGCQLGPDFSALPSLVYRSPGMPRHVAGMWVIPVADGPALTGVLSVELLTGSGKTLSRSEVSLSGLAPYTPVCLEFSEMPGRVDVAGQFLVAVLGAQSPTCLLEYRVLPPAWRLRRWRARLACGYSFAGPSGRVTTTASGTGAASSSTGEKLTVDLASMVGSSSLEDHYWCSGWQTANLQLAAGLRPGESVLEVGCGVGRLAHGLHGWFDGTYVGVDVHGLAIDYCRARFPRFQFHHLDVYSQVYNPEGRQQPADMTLPVEDAKFDIAVLYSVYTHLVPSALLRLTSELARVVKPGGRCLASFLIYDNQTARSHFTLDHAITPYCRVQDKNTPEAAVGYQKAWIEAEFARMGFGVASYWPGNWTGNPGLTVQDQYLFVRNQP